MPASGRWQSAQCPLHEKEVPGVVVPDHIIQRIEKVGSAEELATGIQIARRAIAQYGNGSGLGQRPLGNVQAALDVIAENSIFNNERHKDTKIVVNGLIKENAMKSHLSVAARRDYLPILRGIFRRVPEFSVERCV